MGTSDPRTKSTHEITLLVGPAASAKSDCVVGEAAVVKTLVEVDLSRIATSEVGLSMYMVPSALMCMCLGGRSE